MRRALVFALPLLAFASSCSSSREATPGDAAPPSVDPGVDAGPMGPDGGPIPGGPTLTVLSLNLHCLKTDRTPFASNGERFAAIAQEAAKEQVDVILAQEVCANAAEDARTLLVGALENVTQTGWKQASAFAHPAWEGTPDEAAENVAIFARGDLTAPRETLHRAQGSLPRVMLGATISTALGFSVRVYTIHLDHAAADARAVQGREIASLALVETDDEKLMHQEGLPAIVGGDFNARIDAPAALAMKEFGFVETSGSAGTTRIDHLFVHESAPLRQSDAKILFGDATTAVSDHPGILVRYVIGKSDKPARLTRVVAQGTFTGALSLRGDRAPLGWDRGWPAFALHHEGEPAVAVVTSALPAGAFAYKFVRNETDWALGDNTSGVGQSDNATAPAFP